MGRGPPWAWMAAAVLAAAAGVAAWAGQWGAAVPLGAGALAVLSLGLGSNVLPEVAAALAADGARGAQDVAGLTAMQAAPVLVPHNGDVHAFLGAKALSAHAVGIPRASPPVIHREARSAVGVTVHAPGAGLLRLWEAWEGLPRGRGVEEGVAHVRKALRATGLARRVRVLRAEHRLVVRMQTHAAWTSSATDPVPCFAAALVALAVDRPVRVQEVVAGTTTEVHLEVLPWTG